MRGAGGAGRDRPGTAPDRGRPGTATVPGTGTGIIARPTGDRDRDRPTDRGPGPGSPDRGPGSPDRGRPTGNRPTADRDRPTGVARPETATGIARPGIARPRTGIARPGADRGPGLDSGIFKRRRAGELGERVGTFGLVNLLAFGSVGVPCRHTGIKLVNTFKSARAAQRPLRIFARSSLGARGARDPPSHGRS